MRKLNLQDYLKITNLDVSKVSYMKEEKDSTIYLRGSNLFTLLEENDINVHTDTVYELCDHIMKENNINMEWNKFSIINDNHNPFITESYIPNITNDPILTRFEICEVFSEIMNESVIPQEKLYVIFSKFLNLFKKGDYKKSPVAEERLKICQRELKNMESLLLDLEKDKKTTKDLKSIYSLDVIVKSLVNIGISVGMAVIFKSPGAGMINVTLQGLSGIVKVCDVVIYEKNLKMYINNLKDTENYLKKEIEKLKRKESEQSTIKKESSINKNINSKSVSEIYQ